jgi:hypothetical protein
MKRLLTTLLISAATATAIAATPDKGLLRPAWEWSDDERIAARVAEVSPSGTIEVDGSVHPERYLPFELFGTLLRQVDEPQSQFAAVGHQLYDQRLEQAGVDASRFWNLIRASASPYLTTLARLRAIDDELQFAAHSERTSLRQLRDQVSKRLCSDRIVALNAVRQSLGSGRLDRILYTVIAPGSAISTVANPHEAERLRYVAGGCK